MKKLLFLGLVVAGLSGVATSARADGFRFSLGLPLPPLPFLPPPPLVVAPPRVVVQQPAYVYRDDYCAPRVDYRAYPPGYWRHDRDGWHRRDQHRYDRNGRRY